MKKGNEIKTVVPTLRFPEFQKTEGWKEYKLKSLCEIGNGKDYKHLGSGNIPVYGSGGYMTSVDDFLYDGESVCLGRKGTIDKPIFLTGKFWTVDTLFYTHSFHNCLPKFLYLIFQQINWYKYNEAGGVPSLSKTTIGEINVFVPVGEKGELKEQQKIVDCIFSLDELIEATAQKVEALKEHKKGLMQRLFPAEGKNVPDLRFPEFQETSAWEEKRLGDVVEIKGRIGFRGYTTKDIVEQGDGAISLSPTNITDNGNLNFEKSTYISWEKYEESPEIQLKKGYIVLVKTGSSYGKSALVKELPTKTTVNPQIVVLKPKDGINEHFISALISHSMVQRQIKCAVVGGAIPTLSQDSISKFDILYPRRTSHTLSEQRKIANCLSSLDELIEATSRKVEILKDHKKGLIQQLFPKI